MSYRLRLIITISLLIAISFSVGGTILISTSFRISLEQETQGALTSFQSVQSTLFLLNSLGSQTDYDGLSQVLEQMESQHMDSWQALSVRSTSEILYESNGYALAQSSLPNPGNGQCVYVPVSDQYGHGLLITGVLSAGADTLTLTARFDISHVYQSRDSQQQLFYRVYITVVLVGVATAVILSFVLTHRLRQLTTAVRKISGGDLSTRSRITSRDEFGQLSRDFDAMADKLQENISRLETQMQRQESFMGAFAHELKTPMTSIIGFADLLQQGSLDENTRMMAANYIYSEGHRLERISFKLLDLILLNKDGITMKRVWLSSFLFDVERALEPTLKKKGIRLICRAEQKRVAFEPDLVKSLLYNLVDNAAKAMDGEGIIGIKGIAIPGGCQFQVVDNGRGMEASELTKITEAFYRVDKARSRSQGGAGLGLALCKQIVELHNGNIHFDSHPGKGTRVTVTLYREHNGKT